MVERHRAFDNRQRSYTYSIIQAPFPGWLPSTITVRKTADSGFSCGDGSLDEQKRPKALFTSSIGISRRNFCCLMQKTSGVIYSLLSRILSGSRIFVNKRQTN